MTRTEIRAEIEKIRVQAQIDGYMSRVDPAARRRGARTWWVQIFDLGLDGREITIEVITLTESVPPCTYLSRDELLGAAWEREWRLTPCFFCSDMLIDK